MEDYDDYSDNSVGKGKRGRGHRPKSSSSRSSHSSSGTNELPPILEPETPRTSHNVMQSSRVKYENSDKPVRFVKSDHDIEAARPLDSSLSNNATEENGDEVDSQSRSSSFVSRSRMSLTPSARSSNPQSTSFWAKLKNGFGKKEQGQNTSQTQGIEKPDVNPDKYNKDAQERRVRIVMQMMRKSDELAEEEYHRFQEYKERERKQREINNARLDEKLYRQVARGQLQCDSHQKTLFSLNHLLKMERKHDDSMITSICDILLQKPEMRSELMAYVRQEHDAVHKMLDQASKKNPSTDLTKLQTAMANLQKSPEEKSESSDGMQVDEVAQETIDDEPVLAPRKHRRRKKKIDKSKDDPEQSPRLHKNHSKLSVGRTDLDKSHLETKAKTPAYPTAENMIHARCDTVGNGKIPPTGKIEDKELADYVKSLESTVDDKLRVLLDTHSNRTDSKSAGNIKERKATKMSKV